MEDSVKIILDNEEYELVYNEQTDLYELSLEAPLQTGVHNIEVSYTSGDDTAIDDIDLIVLKLEEREIPSEETIAYFLDKMTLEILEVVQLSIEEINRDLETNGNSLFTSIKKLNIEEGDFIYLKKNDKTNFLGVVVSQEKSSDSVLYTITCKDILSLFDFSMFVENDDIISTTGIEDFIKQTIENEFINNTDTFVNREFLSVEALTHSKKNISISSIVTVSSNMYNLLTFINNAIKIYCIIKTYAYFSKKDYKHIFFMSVFFLIIFPILQMFLFLHLFFLQSLLASLPQRLRLFCYELLLFQLLVLYLQQLTCMELSEVVLHVFCIRFFLLYHQLLLLLLNLVTLL